MFRYPIVANRGVSLEFSEDDLDLVSKMAFDFQLYHLTLNDLHENLILRGNDGLMSYTQFHELFRELGSMRRDDAKLASIFKSFDRTESGYCDVAELTCGLSILCQGSKSSKLLFAFRLLDEDKDEFLTRRGIWRFIRSFLCVLLTISSSFNEMESDQLNALLDDLSVLISSEILANDAKRASFDMISSWYSTKGYLNSTWIELLDLKKWITIPDWSAEEGDVPVEGEDTDVETGDDESSDEEDEEDEESGEEYYQASLSAGHSLIINASDTAHVLAVSAASGLSTMEPRELVEQLARYSRDGVINEAGFLAFLNNLSDMENRSNDVRNKVYSDLFSIFNIFEQHSDTSSRGAEFRSLAVGLTVLCNGSKSAKLEVGFRVFEDEDLENGRITSESLSSFLGSYLLVLAALQVVENSNIAIDTAIALSQVISEMLNGVLTFPSFGKWYNVEGFNYAPWIELLNLDKWEKITGFKSAGNNVYYEKDEEEEEEEEEESEQEDRKEEKSNDDAFSIILNSHAFERKISVTKACASHVFNTTREIMSHSCDIATLVPELLAVSQDGLISRKDFLATLVSLRFNAYTVLHGTESFMLMLFDAFDRSNSGYCDLNELVTGVVMLDHHGTKSEKLVYAFDFIDKDSTGVISKRDIWKFFRSFLISVLLLSCPELRPSDYLHILVDESAVWVVESILSFVAKDSDVTPSCVSFDDIADWYSSVGCTISAWIELLDFSKWIFLSSS